MLGLAFGASFRMTSDLHFKNTIELIANNALKGVSGRITIKFGKFKILILGFGT